MDIPSKNQLIEDLKKTFNATKLWINEQPDDHFNKELIPNKWTIAEHLYHLIKSTKAVSNGMKMTKEQLLEMFGENNRKEKSFDELKLKYETALAQINVAVPKDYKAKEGRTFDQSELMSRFDHELHELVQILNQWNEKDMGHYIMPHPLLGKFTIREFIYFTIFHTAHHLNSLKKKYVLA